MTGVPGEVAVPLGGTTGSSPKGAKHPGSTVLQPHLHLHFHQGPTEAERQACKERVSRELCPLARARKSRSALPKHSYFLAPQRHARVCTLASPGGSAWPPSVGIILRFCLRSQVKQEKNDAADRELRAREKERGKCFEGPAKTFANTYEYLDAREAVWYRFSTRRWGAAQQVHSAVEQLLRAQAHAASAHACNPENLHMTRECLQSSAWFVHDQTVQDRAVKDSPGPWHCVAVMVAAGHAWPGPVCSESKCQLDTALHSAVHGTKFRASCSVQCPISTLLPTHSQR